MSLEYKVLAQSTTASIESGDGLFGYWGYWNQGRARLYFTTDGESYEALGEIGTTSAGSQDYAFRSLAYGEGKFVAVTYEPYPYDASGLAIPVARYSTDGVTWEIGSIPNTGSAPYYNSINDRPWAGVAYGQDKFGAISDYGDLIESTDGVTWTHNPGQAIATNEIPNLPSSYRYNDFYYYNQANLWIATPGWNSSTVIHVSTDLVTWETRVISQISTKRYGISSPNGILIIPTWYNSATVELSYSTDAVTWSNVNLPPEIQRHSSRVTYGDGKYFTVSYSGTPYATYSTDLATWTISALPTSYNGYNFNSGWNGSVFLNGKFLVYPIKSSSSHPDYSFWASSDNLGVWNAVLQESEPNVNSRWNQFISTTLPGYDVLANNDLYTCPEDKQTIISSIYVSNTSSSESGKYFIAVVPNGEELSNVHYLRKNIDIGIEEFHSIDTKITLSAGDKIVTYGNRSAISINVFGVEK